MADKFQSNFTKCIENSANAFCSEVFNNFFDKVVEKFGQEEDGMTKEKLIEMFNEQTEMNIEKSEEKKAKKAPAKKKKDDDAETCTATLKNGSNCSAKAKNNGLCGRHSKDSSKKEEKKSKPKKKAEGKKKKAESDNDDDDADKEEEEKPKKEVKKETKKEVKKEVKETKKEKTLTVTKMNDKTVPIKANQWGEFQDENGFIFDEDTRMVKGKAADGGETKSLTKDDIKKLTSLGYKYDAGGDASEGDASD